MNKQFIEAVNTNDILTVRLFLSNELLLDPRGSSFDEMLEYAEVHCSDLYEDACTSFEINEDASQWSQRYLNDLKNELDTHFIKKLLVHYKEVAQIVLKEKGDNIKMHEEMEKLNNRHGSTQQKKIACGTLLASGTALTITGLILSKGLIVKSGAICIIAGGYLTYKLLKEQNHGK